MNPERPAGGEAARHGNAKGYLRVTLLTLVAVSLAGCARHEEAGESQPVSVVKGVTLEMVKLEQITDITEVSGTVRARSTAVIAARIPGTVTAVNAREGDRVAKGRLLVTIAAAESAASAAGAMAGVEEALRGVEEAMSRTRLAEATLGRYRNLFEEQAVTRQEYETKQMEHEVAQQGLARAKARLSQARESAKSADAVAGYSRITAPISGMVTAKNVETGMTVFPGSPLMTIEEGGAFRLEVPVPENMLGRIRSGEKVAVSVEGVSGRDMFRVSEIVPAVDPATRSFMVKIDLPGGTLRSGMYGKASFPSGSREGIQIPKKALFDRGALTMVWVVDGNKVVKLRLVKPGREDGEKVEILSGLSAGDRVVVSGGETLTEGARLE